MFNAEYNRLCLFCLEEQDQPRTNQTNQCPVCGRNILIQKEDKSMINNNLQPMIKDVLKDVIRENIDNELLRSTIQEVLSEMLRGNHNEEQLTQEEEDEYEESEFESTPAQEDRSRKNCIDYEFREFLKNNYTVDKNSSISRDDILSDFGKNINKRRFGGTIKSVFGNIIVYKMLNKKNCALYQLKRLRRINDYCETCGQYSKDAHKPKGKEIPCPSCGNALREIE
jgi:DNA-directed RNA polymerase subunit RPC12/RpoP